MTLLFGLIGVASPRLPATEVSTNEPADNDFRVAVSLRVLGDVNPADARASLRAWGQAILRRVSVPYETQLDILGTPEATREALAPRAYDMVLLTSEECLTTGVSGTNHHYFVDTAFDPTGADRYVLLARNDPAIKSLADLKGRSLAILDHANNSLARQWLDLELVTNGLAAPEEFFRSITGPRKLSSAVLPVFFGSLDASVVPRRGFETICELNPQVKKRLRIVAESGLVLSRVILFNARPGSPYNDPILTSIRTIHESPAGQQILNLFQSGRAAEAPASCLDGAERLLQLHRKLLASLATPAFSTPVAGPTLILNPTSADSTGR